MAPQRRSRRLASQEPEITEPLGLYKNKFSLATSRLSPVPSLTPEPASPPGIKSESDHDHEHEHEQEKGPKGKGKDKPSRISHSAAPFFPLLALQQITDGDRSVITTLTKANLIALVNTMADHGAEARDKIEKLEGTRRALIENNGEVSLRLRIKDLESENAELKQKTEAAILKAKMYTPMRYAVVTKDIRETAAKLKAEQAAKEAAEKAMAAKEAAAIEAAVAEEAAAASKAQILPAPSQRDVSPISTPPQSPSGQEDMVRSQAMSTPSRGGDAALAMTPAPAWRRVMQSVGSLFSPFARKRLVTDEAEGSSSAPPAKRARLQVIDEPQNSSSLDDMNISEWSEPQAQSTPLAFTRGAQIALQAIEDTQAPAPATQVTATPSSAASTTASRKRRAPPTSEPQQTPKESPRHYAGPSAKYPGLPTSLNTITEYTEPASSILNMPDPTPTRPAPIRERRSILKVRAARLAAAQATPKPKLAWQRVDTPREAMEERRTEKSLRPRSLEKQLKALQEDEDIVEMQSHRRKRVKVDDLLVIPHNRPGEAEGTFRVPDIDSDDEMEVAEDWPVRQNVFGQNSNNIDLTDASTPAAKQSTPEQSTTGTRDSLSTQSKTPRRSQRLQTLASASKDSHIQGSAALPPASTTPFGTNTLYTFPSVNSPSTPPSTVTPRATSRYVFPNVGPRLPEHTISAQQSEELTRKFKLGFEEFRRENGMSI